MLKLLLDEHVARAVAAGVRRRREDVAVDALVEWRGGALIGQDDVEILRTAAQESWTLVTYDRRTIPVLLKEWAEQGLRHGGVVFVDEKTIAPSDVGGLVRALVELCAAGAEWDWTDRVVFLVREQ